MICTLRRIQILQKASACAAAALSRDSPGHRAIEQKVGQRPNLPAGPNSHRYKPLGTIRCHNFVHLGAVKDTGSLQLASKSSLNIFNLNFRFHVLPNFLKIRNIKNSKKNLGPDKKPKV